MNKELSSDAQYFLETLSEGSIIEPDDWHFTLSSGGKRFGATPQLKRHLIRKALVEVNQYKLEFLSDQIKRDFNLTRSAKKDDLLPTEAELNRLRDKLEKLAEDGQVSFWIKCLNEDPHYKIENTIVSSWMIDIKDVIAYLEGESPENLYHITNERRRKFDSP